MILLQQLQNNAKIDLSPNIKLTIETMVGNACNQICSCIQQTYMQMIAGNLSGMMTSTILATSLSSPNFASVKESFEKECGKDVYDQMLLLGAASECFGQRTSDKVKELKAVKLNTDENFLSILNGIRTILNAPKLVRQQNPQLPLSSSSQIGKRVPKAIERFDPVSYISTELQTKRRRPAQQTIDKEKSDDNTIETIQKNVEEVTNSINNRNNTETISSAITPIIDNNSSINYRSTNNLTTTAITTSSSGSSTSSGSTTSSASCSAIEGSALFLEKTLEEEAGKDCLEESNIDTKHDETSRSSSSNGGGGVFDYLKHFGDEKYSFEFTVSYCCYLLIFMIIMMLILLLI